MANEISVDLSQTVIQTTVSLVPLNIDVEENVIDASIPDRMYQIDIDQPVIAVSSVPAPTINVTVGQPEVVINLTAIGGTIIQATWGETPIGSINGTNQSYTTAKPYTAGLLAVFLNGLRLRRIADYIETSNQSFQFLSAPLPGDSLSIDYM